MVEYFPCQHCARFWIQNDLFNCYHTNTHIFVLEDTEVSGGQMDTSSELTFPDGKLNPVISKVLTFTSPQVGRTGVKCWPRSDEGASSAQEVRSLVTLLEKGAWSSGPSPMPRLGAMPKQGQGPVASRCTCRGTGSRRQVPGRSRAGSRSLVLRVRDSSVWKLEGRTDNWVDREYPVTGPDPQDWGGTSCKPGLMLRCWAGIQDFMARSGIKLVPQEDLWYLSLPGWETC